MPFQSTMSPLERFQTKLEQPDGPDGCWLWTAARNRDGYGVFTHNNRYIRAHRFAYEQFIGPVPDGWKLQHTCGHAHCVNPAHLIAVEEVKIDRPRGDPVARFLSKLDKTSSPDGCWLWTGTRAKTGYGVINIDGRLVLAHRFAYEHFVDTISPGRQVLHRCDCPPCCNPAHLFAGSHADNMRDKTEKGRQSKGEDRPLARLTDSAVREVRQLYYQGMSIPDLAGRFGVSPRTIRNVLAGTTWKHVI